MKGSQLTVRLSDELMEEIEQECNDYQYEIPKSEVVRAALETYFSYDGHCPHCGNQIVED
ncbi:ribbon-helix-helix protein, CopG family [Natrinema salinisoli]|uniref:ribbon-helix-helix protein, CopG family n=1 Tax=Natrinema salinisoli TaxID=2878535 RepID=UPI001CF061D9